MNGWGPKRTHTKKNKKDRKRLIGKRCVVSQRVIKRKEKEEKKERDLNQKARPKIHSATSDQRCKTRIRFILHILYYKVYNSSCSQVGHDLIDRVKSSPKQIKFTASICKHILCDDGSAACSGIDASMQRTWSIRSCPT